MNIQLTIPTTWNQIPPTAIKKIAVYFYKNKAGKELDVLLYFALLNIQWWQFKKIAHAFKWLKVAPISEIKQHFLFLYKEVSLTKFSCTVADKNNTLLKTPGDRLHNITIEQFAVCEDIYFQFTQSQNIELLRFLVGALYLETTFDKNKLEEYANNLSKIDKKTLLAIQLSYKGSSLYIQSQYPNVFKKRVASENALPTKPSAPNFGKFIQQLAGGKFGNLTETKQTNIHDFLAEMDLLIKNAK